MKVYIINTKMLTEEDATLDLNSLSDSQFISITMKSGDTYSIRGFENAYNQDDFDHVNTYIRFIE